MPLLETFGISPERSAALTAENGLSSNLTIPWNAELMRQQFGRAFQRSDSTQTALS